MSQLALDAGRILVRLKLTGQGAGHRVAEVEINSERPQLASALQGKPADQAVKLVPLMFALCGRAQGQAAALALSAARGIDTLPYLDPEIESEVMREHAWRLALDLPPLLGMTPLQELFLQMQMALKRSDRETLGTLLDHAVWQELLNDLPGNTSTSASADVSLPSISATESFQYWLKLNADFSLHPMLCGATAETGAWARRIAQACLVGTGFMARWQARYDELRSWAQAGSRVGGGGTASAAACPVKVGNTRVGRALVDTARGLLMHEITLNGDLIADYVIVAPTEWNFHPRGTLANWLCGYCADDESSLRRYAAQCIAALDPCVRWELELG